MSKKCSIIRCPNEAEHIFDDGFGLCIKHMNRVKEYLVSKQEHKDPNMTTGTKTQNTFGIY